MRQGILHADAAVNDRRWVRDEERCDIGLHVIFDNVGVDANQQRAVLYRAEETGVKVGGRSGCTCDGENAPPWDITTLLVDSASVAHASQVELGSWSYELGQPRNIRTKK